jgi:hypothetical protein
MWDMSTFWHILDMSHPSQWLRDLRRRSVATRLLRVWVQIPPGAWIFVCCECCELSGRGLCDELITHPEEYYRLWRIIVCDLEALWMRRPWHTGGCCAKTNKQTKTWHESMTVAVGSKACTLSSTAQTMGLWVWIPLTAQTLPLLAFFFCAVLYRRGLTTCWHPVKGVLQNV